MSFWVAFDALAWKAHLYGAGEDTETALSKAGEESAYYGKDSGGKILVDNVECICREPIIQEC